MMEHDGSAQWRGAMGRADKQARGVAGAPIKSIRERAIKDHWLAGPVGRYEHAIPERRNVGTAMLMM